MTDQSPEGDAGDDSDPPPDPRQGPTGPGGELPGPPRPGEPGDGFTGPRSGGPGSDAYGSGTYGGGTYGATDAEVGGLESGADPTVAPESSQTVVNVPADLVAGDTYTQAYGDETERVETDSAEVSEVERVDATVIPGVVEMTATVHDARADSQPPDQPAQTIRVDGIPTGEAFGNPTIVQGRGQGSGTSGETASGVGWTPPDVAYFRVVDSANVLSELVGSLVDNPQLVTRLLAQLEQALGDLDAAEATIVALRAQNAQLKAALRVQHRGTAFNLITAGFAALQIVVGGVAIHTDNQNTDRVIAAQAESDDADRESDERIARLLGDIQLRSAQAIADGMQGQP